MNSMNLIGKFISNFRDFYNEINAATLTGAIDVVVVEQPDGSYTCSPFHVRFGKLGVLRSREKIVDIEINGEPLDIHMKLGESGEAFFVEEVPEDEDDEEIPPHLACSPIPLPEHLNAWMQDQDEKERQMAKVFVAETVWEERKPSLVPPEFRPIEEKKTDTISSNEGDSESIRTDNGESSSASLNQQQSVGGGGGGGGGKRKRRKKSNVKRKTSAHKQAFQSEGVAAAIPQDPLKTENASEAVATAENQKDAFIEGILRHSEELERITLTNETDYHFFSDTELTPGCSPESRPPSPIASDTEVEQRRHLEDSNEVTQSWKWGELPSPLPRPSATSSKSSQPTPEEEEAAKKQEQEEAQKSIISGMFSFMKKTKHLRHGQQEGVYLSDLNTDDPEVTALYFPGHYPANAGTEESEFHGEDDAESGNGPSIPVSPSSQSPPPSGEWNSTNRCECLEVSMSLCGHLDTGVSEELFNQFVLSYDEFVANPMMMEHPDLVIRVGGQYYNWRMAWPIIMSQVLFKKALPQPVVDLLSNEAKAAGKLKEMNDKGKSGGYSSWFIWRRSATAAEEETPMAKETTTPLETAAVSDPIPIKQEVVELEVEKELDKQAEAEKEEGYAGSNSSEDSDTPPSQSQTKLPKERRHYQLTDKCRKTLRLTSEQIGSLNLQDGANEVEFSVTTAYQGTTRCKCHIYKWRHDDKVVISDIDGTITKSDVLGHVLPIVGKDWAQSGVAQLFTKIKNNGYKLLYLSSRAIGQARVTREYLRSIKQGDLSLPDGPLLLNPTSLISAFHREVIERKPEEFKISCLRDILALFPQDTKPFYAGYGNRVNDVWAYRAVGIPIVRIFTINYKGELKHELTQTFQSSYGKMCQLVDEMFPPPHHEVTEDYGNFLFWRDPLPEIDIQLIDKPEVKT